MPTKLSKLFLIFCLLILSSAKDYVKVIHNIDP